MQVLGVERREVFTGDVTGSVDVTAMRHWLESTNAKMHDCAMYKWNVEELIKAHEWDNTFVERIESLKKAKRWTPLISVESEEGVFVIDGWHRLYMLNANVPPIPKAVVKFFTYLVTLEDCENFRPRIFDAGEVDRKEPNQMAEKEQDKVEEESYGGTFGSVVTPAGSALVHNRIEAPRRELDADETPS